jgi:hypothetical protein
LSEERGRSTGMSDSEFGPETGFESESSVSDKAFFQEEAVNPIVQHSVPEGNEEYAAELAAPASIDMADRRKFGDANGMGAGRAETVGAGTILGYLALILAVLSLFSPSILGPVSAVVGFMAFVKGSRALGIWSIVIGTVAFVSFLSTIPYQY